LVVAPAALLHPSVPQPDGIVLHELLTGHPDREAHGLVFVADLTVERAWPTDAWASLGVDPQAAAGAVIAAWRGGHLMGLQLGGLTAAEAMAPTSTAAAVRSAALDTPAARSGQHRGQIGHRRHAADAATVRVLLP
jgi:hypothetical protein